MLPRLPIGDSLHLYALPPTSTPYLPTNIPQSTYHQRHNRNRIPIYLEIARHRHLWIQPVYYSLTRCKANALAVAAARRRRTVARSDTYHGAPHARPEHTQCIQPAYAQRCPTEYTATPRFHPKSFPSCPVHPPRAPLRHQSTGYLAPRRAGDTIRETNSSCIRQTSRTGAPIEPRRSGHLRTPASGPPRRVARQVTQGSQNRLKPRPLVLIAVHSKPMAEQRGQKQWHTSIRPKELLMGSPNPCSAPDEPVGWLL